MNAKSAQWLLGKMRAHGRVLASQLQEQTDLKAKKMLVEHYIELTRSRADEKAPDSKAVLEEAMKLWAKSYPGKLPT